MKPASIFRVTRYTVFLSCLAHWHVAFHYPAWIAGTSGWPAPVGLQSRNDNFGKSGQSERAATGVFDLAFHCRSERFLHLPLQCNLHLLIIQANLDHLLGGLYVLA